MTRASSSRSAQQSGLFTAAVGAVWLLLALPAWLRAGSLGLEGLSCAALLNLVPGWLVFWVSSRGNSANAPVKAVLFGMGLRISVVLGGVAVIQSIRPFVATRAFLVWVLVFYLAALTVETVLLVRKQSA